METQTTPTLGADSEKLVFGALKKSVFVRIASFCGALCNGGFLYFTTRDAVFMPNLVPLVVTGIVLYLLAFIVSEVFKNEQLSVVILLVGMDLMFFTGLFDQHFQFFTIVLSPLIPSFTLLLLGYRQGSIWFYSFLTLVLALTFVPLIPSSSLRQILASVGHTSPLSFSLPVLIGIANISGFAVLFQNYLENSTRTIQTQVAEITRLSMTDPLTLIYNRRAFMKMLEGEYARSKRITWRIDGSKNPDQKIGPVDENLGHLSVLLFDVDHFKRVNDSYGHPIGDKVLFQFADILQNRKLLRETDCIARFGGEEFIVFEPDTNIQGALLSAERIRTYLQDQVFVTETGNEFRVTVSCGISERRASDTSVDDLVSRSDRALYRAKHDGRNRCALYADSL